MFKVVYVQKENNDWLNENCFAAAKGFGLMGYDVRGFNLDEIESLDLKKSDIVHGGINTVRKVFDILGVGQPEIHHPQDFLLKYCNRSFTLTTLGEIRKIYNGFPFFIKPLNDHKLFTGFPVGNNFLDLMKVRHLDDNIQVVKSEYVKFISEYRCFVLDKKLVGAKHYTGDFKVFPNFEIIENAIVDYGSHQPTAYSIDFGVTDKGDTVLIV